MQMLSELYNYAKILDVNDSFVNIKEANEATLLCNY